jgi:DNA-binding transcriptional regulator LsrR (DeoR family)
MRGEMDQQLSELIAIKKLLVIGLLNSGLTQSQVAGALGIDRSQISRMFPKGTLTGLGGREKSDG